MRQFLEWMPNHYRTEKPVIHISLNPHPDDVLTDSQLAEIGREYMQRLGYGNQPYLVFFLRTSAGIISTSFPCVSTVRGRERFPTSSNTAAARRFANFWNRNTDCIRRKVRRKAKSGS
ncbi:relaxase/mobilization nuclease domain-containing protein [Bacteroides ovatus]|nr:relaxase/mobilization nuclease domain-containing protein [Bacteroides ovatus]